MSNWQRLDTKIVYQNPHFTVHEDAVIRPDGKAMHYGWVETTPAAYVIAVEDNGEIVLVKQVRYTTGQPTWELPAGNTDGEEQLQGAKRELEEEAGYHADKWVSLLNEVYAWNGIATERNSLHIARGLHKAKTIKHEVDGKITEVKSFSWAKIKEMIKNGEINDSQSISALSLAGLYLGHLK